MTELPAFPALRGRRSGTLRILADRVVFTPDEAGEATLALPHERLTVSLEGENSAHYFLADVENPDDAICVQDPEAIRKLAKRGVRAATAVLGAAGERRTKRAAWIGSSFAVPIALIVALPVLLSFVPVAWFEGLVPQRLERRIGRWFLSVEEKANRPSATPTEDALRALATHLRNATPELARVELDVYFSPDGEVNAYALPGGIIRINRGFLDQAKSVEEVAGVLAHEMAHVELRHSLKAMTGQAGALVGYLFLAAVVGSDAAGAIGKATDLFAMKHSRATEAEADARAVVFLRNARVSADGMIAFFSRLAKEREGAVATALAFLSTHPLSNERIAAIRTEVEKTPYSSAPLPVTAEQLGMGGGR